MTLASKFETTDMNDGSTNAADGSKEACPMNTAELTFSTNRKLVYCAFGVRSLQFLVNLYSELITVFSIDGLVARCSAPQHVLLVRRAEFPLFRLFQRFEIDGLVARNNSRLHVFDKSITALLEQVEQGDEHATQTGLHQLDIVASVWLNRLAEDAARDRYFDFDEDRERFKSGLESDNDWRQQLQSSYCKYISTPSRLQDCNEDLSRSERRFLKSTSNELPVSAIDLVMRNYLYAFTAPKIWTDARYDRMVEFSLQLHEKGTCSPETASRLGSLLDALSPSQLLSFIGGELSCPDTREVSR